MKNKNLLITGAATRVGKAIALHFAERGWNIALHYFRSSSKAKKLKKIIEQNWVKVALIKADLKNSKQTEKIITAARNIEGKAILYADKKTKSIEKAIEETDRRRKLQIAYNKKNNISATSIKKEITDILESIYERDYAKINVDTSIGHNLKKHLKSLKKKMKEAAENLEFEEAAKIRDEIRKLEASELEIGINPKIRQSKLQSKIYPEGRSTQGKPGTKPRRKR